MIMEVSPGGEPTAPERVLGPYKSVSRIAVMDHVPISYRICGLANEVIRMWFLI